MTPLHWLDGLRGLLLDYLPALAIFLLGFGLAWLCKPRRQTPAPAPAPPKGFMDAAGNWVNEPYER